MEAWATGGGYSVMVYRETKHGGGYKKIKEYGWAGPKRAGILWVKRRAYAVMWQRQEEEGKGQCEAGGGVGEEYRRGTPSQAISAGEDRE